MWYSIVVALIYPGCLGSEPANLGPAARSSPAVEAWERGQRGGSFHLPDPRRA